MFFFDDGNKRYYGVKSEIFLTFRRQKHGNDSNIVNIVVSSDRRHYIKLYAVYLNSNNGSICYFINSGSLQMDCKIKDKNLKLGHSLEIQWVFLFDDKNIVYYGVKS